MPRPRCLLPLMIAVALAGSGCSGAAHDGDKSKDPASRPVPVSAAVAAKRDVPIYLEGLGSVIAYKTVTVRPQVDGRLDKVLFREGQVVKKGDVLAQIDPRPFLVLLHQAEGALVRDNALLSDARRNQERYQTLLKQNLIAQQQLDTTSASVGQYQGAVQIDQAQVESARLQLEYARVTAPIDGVTGVRLVDEGNLVRAGDTGGLVVLTQLDPIAVLFTLPQDDLPRLLQQMPGGALTVEAYSRDGEARLGQGTVEVLDNQINQATASVRLKAVLKNPERSLWPNQFVKVRLLLTVRKDALVVPVTAVQRGPKGTFAYVIGADQTVQPRPVEVAQTAGDVAVLTRGVAAGEQVVTDGQNQLRPGSKVAPRDSAAKPAGAGR